MVERLPIAELTRDPTEQIHLAGPDVDQVNDVRPDRVDGDVAAIAAANEVAVVACGAGLARRKIADAVVGRHQVAAIAIVHVEELRHRRLESLRLDQ